ncbi:MAG: hypothetical protein HY914_15635 [Desulfomonile tiedjei]|nr:hypothetical protein [Desulfomonile tiedjei]
MNTAERFFDPFSVFGPPLDTRTLQVDTLHDRPVSESVTLQEGLLIMIGKLMEITRLIAGPGVKGGVAELEWCQELAREVHRLEKILTGNFLASGWRGDVFKGLLRLPVRLERIGDMLESILNCCRIKAEDGIPFCDRSLEELDQLFGLLREILGNLGAAVLAPDRKLLERILSLNKRLSDTLLDYRLAHWDRVEAGLTVFQASSLYLDILDSVTSANEYVKRMSTTLLELGKTDATTSATREGQPVRL